MAEEFAEKGYVKAEVFDPDDIGLVAAELCDFLLESPPRDMSMSQTRRQLAQDYRDPSPVLISKLSLMSSLLTLSGVASRAEHVGKSLGLAFPVLSSPPEVRTDFPRDEKYAQQWHVDWPYAQTSVNSITIWTPLHDVNREDGALKVIPGSHRFPIRKFEKQANPRKFTVDMEDSAAQACDIEVALGESLVFSQNLIHASGFNVTDMVRMSFQIRLADALHPEWMQANFARGDLKSTTIRKLAGHEQDRSAASRTSGGNGDGHSES
jgi:hypothetical protein